MTDIREQIAKLLEQFGPQGWWPRIVRSGSKFDLCYHAERQPGCISRTAAERAFEVALGAILTQNTAWRNVEPALLYLAGSDLITSRAIARSRLISIERCVKSSGYFRQKAKRLKLFAQFVEHELVGDLSRSLECKDPRALLLSQWGIGPETADTILLYGLHQPYFVVDSYTKRWLAEMTQDQRWLKSAYDEVQKFCVREMPGSVQDWQAAHALIVAWGKSKSNFSLCTTA